MYGWIRIGQWLSMISAHRLGPLTYLVLLRSFLAKSKSGRHAHRQVVSTDVVCLGLLNYAPVLLQVLNLVAVRCCEVCAHAAVMSSDDHTTASGGLLCVVEVPNSEASSFVGLEKCLGVLVLSDTAEEHHGVGWEEVLLRATSVSRGLPDPAIARFAARMTRFHQTVCSISFHCRAYLSASCCVLSSTTRDQLRIAVLDKLLVEGHVLLLGENGVVGLEAVLLEESLISVCIQCSGQQSSCMAIAGLSWLAIEVGMGSALTPRPGCREEGSPSREARSYRWQTCP